MNIQDKVGKDNAKDLERMFESITQGNPDRMAILKNTKMYKFMTGTYVQEHKLPIYENGKIKKDEHGKLMYDRKFYKNRVPCSVARSRIVLPFEVERLRIFQVIDEDTSNNLLNMISSKDEENLIVAEAVINKHREIRLKKIRMEQNKMGVALTKEICPICAVTEMDGDIVINKRLSVSEAKKVETLHGKIVGFSKEPCEKCKEYKSLGFVLIGAVEAKTEDATNPYRSGNIWVVKEEVAVKLFGKDIPKSGVAFIDVTVAHQMGLPGSNLNA